MEKATIENHCDLGIKDSCITCEFMCFCNGKWSHATK